MPWDVCPCPECLCVPPAGPIFAVTLGTPRPKMPSKLASKFSDWLTIRRRLLFLALLGKDFTLEIMLLTIQIKGCHGRSGVIVSPLILKRFLALQC